MKYILFFASTVLLNAYLGTPACADECSLNEQLSHKLKQMRASARNDEDIIILQDGTQIIGHVDYLPKIKFKEGERSMNAENLLCIQVGLHEGKTKMQLISKEGKGYLCDIPEERFSVIQYFPSLQNPTHKLQQEISAHTISQIIFRRGDDRPVVEEMTLNVIDPKEEEEIRAALKEHKHKEGCYRSELSHLREAHEDLNTSLQSEKESFRGKESLYRDQILQLELAAQTLTERLQDQCERAERLKEELEHMRKGQDEWKEEYGFFRAAIDQKIQDLALLKDAQNELNEDLLSKLEELSSAESKDERGTKLAEAAEQIDQLNQTLAELQSDYGAEQMLRQQLESQLKILNAHIHQKEQELAQLKQGKTTVLANNADELQQENIQLKAQLKNETEKFGVMKTHLSGVLLKYEQEKAQRQALEKRLKITGEQITLERG